MPNNDSGRGNAFTRAENEYIVSKCLRAISGKEKIRDIDIATILNRGKNNIAIRRRKLGFMYKNDPQTGEVKVVYKRPKSKDYYVNIEKIDVNKCIAIIEMKQHKKELSKKGESIENIKLSDFYPDGDFDTYKEQELNTARENIETMDVEGDVEKAEDAFSTDYDDNKNVEHFESDRFVKEENEAEEIDPMAFFDKPNNDNDNSNKLEAVKETSEDLAYFSSATFSSMKKSFDSDEWEYFKSRWKAYMATYGAQFDEVSDWDDLVGYLSEQIKRNRLLQKEKEYDEDYSKELSLCSGRLNDYKKNLATSRNSRIQQKVDTRLNIADIIKLFEDDKNFIEINYMAEIELRGMSKYIRKELLTAGNIKDFSKIDGNEAALLIGLPASYEELSKLLE